MAKERYWEQRSVISEEWITNQLATLQGRLYFQLQGSVLKCFVLLCILICACIYYELNRFLISLLEPNVPERLAGPKAIAAILSNIT